MPEFKTSISDVGTGTVNLRGYSLADVMRNLDFASGLHLTLIGRLPTEAEQRLLQVVLNSLLDHGFVASTITAARYAASGNPQLVPAVAAGLLAAGSNTLSPQDTCELLDHAARLRRDDGLSFAEAAQRIVEEHAAARKRIPGLGHPTHKDSDFRADILFEVADELKLAGDGCKQFRAVHQAFLARTGKSGIPINIDGALAAVGMDLGWSVRQTVSLALLSVLPGLMAHVIEEIDSNVPLRYIENGSYTGESLGSRTL
jgi:citrate synthase